MDRGDGKMAVAGDRRVLVVAASDSSGGAGLSRDIETIAALGGRGAVALTAVTVQTHAAVHCVEPVDPSLVARQMQAAFAANRVGAVKIGLVPTAASASAIASVLRAHPDIPVVLDPVLVASSGGSLAGTGTTDAIIGELLPCATLVTPNRDELSAFSGQPCATDCDAVLAQARAMLAAGASAVLAKGGHGTGPFSTDHLLRPGQAPIPFAAPRLDRTMRGTGCMLSSAVAAGLEGGATLEDSIAAAKTFVHAQLSESQAADGRDRDECRP